MRGGTRPRQRGFSIIELMLAMAGTVVIFGIVVLGTQRAFGTWRATVSDTELERIAVRSLDRVVATLADASIATIADDLAAPTGGASITFQAFGPAADGTATLGPAVTFAWSSDPNDPEDGADNDGDGLVDEGRIVRTDTTGNSVVLVQNVTAYLDGETSNSMDDNGNGLIDERGFCFELDGRELTVRLTLSKRNAEGEIVTRSAESAVRLRE